MILIMNIEQVGWLIGIEVTNSCNGVDISVIRIDYVHCSCIEDKSIVYAFQHSQDKLRQSIVFYGSL